MLLTIQKLSKRNNTDYSDTDYSDTDYSDTDYSDTDPFLFVPESMG